MAWNRRSCSISPRTVTADRSSADAPGEDADLASPADGPLDGFFVGSLAWVNSETATTASAESTMAMRRPILTVWLVGEFTPRPMYHAGSASLPFAVPILGRFWKSAGA
jgi:hypothetical protein